MNDRGPRYPNGTKVTAPALGHVINCAIGTVEAAVPEWLRAAFGEFDVGAERAGILHLMRLEREQARTVTRMNADERRWGTQQMVSRMYAATKAKFNFTEDQMTVLYVLLGIWDKNRYLTPEYGGKPRRPEKKKRNRK